LTPERAQAWPISPDTVGDYSIAGQEAKTPRSRQGPVLVGFLKRSRLLICLCVSYKAIARWPLSSETGDR
jgi:hypothetical protein